MTEAEAKRWIRCEIAREIRERISETSDRIGNAPDPKLVESLWTHMAYDIADHVWPEGKPV